MMFLKVLPLFYYCLQISLSKKKNLFYLKTYDKLDVSLTFLFNDFLQWLSLKIILNEDCLKVVIRPVSKQTDWA